MRANLFSHRPRVLILAPTLKDSEMTVRILSASSIDSLICRDLHHLCQEIDSGADAAIVAENFLRADESGVLGKVLDAQAEWSDFPIIVLTSSERGPLIQHGPLESIGNMTLLARPLKIANMMSTIRSALRDRARQYRILDCINAAERNQMELRASEARFHDMADSINQMIWVAQPDGYREYYNKRWYEYTGMPEDSIDVEAWSGVYHPEDQPRAWRRWQHSLDTGTPYAIEYRLRRADGEYRWILERAEFVRDDEGNVLKWYGTCTDIQELVDAQETARSANRAKSDFLANMSHEIRTPINAIIGLANILKSEEMTAKQKDLISVLSASADSLSCLINDLLNIGKIEAGMIELEIIPFTFAEVLEKVGLIVSGKAEEKGLQVRLDYKAVSDATYMGDPARLVQIFINLTNNAIKFTEQGSVEIVVKASRLEQTSDLVTVLVIDTGIGVSKENYEKIFDKFAQADSSINRHYGGTGLGLTISKRLVEAMEGEIEVCSEPGRGSIFSVKLPLSHHRGGEEQPSSRHNKSLEPLASGATDKVLLVEENRFNMLVESVLLRRFGYDCDVANSGMEAIAKATSHSYLAVLMDVQMPGMDGLEATERIRQREKESGSTPHYIIGLTAHALSGDRDRCLAAGMNDYLPKPFEPERLQHLLRAKSAGARVK